jgi:hypothetical protein
MDACKHDMSLGPARPVIHEQQTRSTHQKVGLRLEVGVKDGDVVVVMQQVHALLAGDTVSRSSPQRLLQ